MDASVELVKHLLRSVVNLHVTAPRDHPSAKLLGTERMGSGVIVDASGLILTVNYVVMGGQTIYVAAPGAGRRVRAEIVAQDFDVGLAVLRVKRQGLAPAYLGSGRALERGDAVVAVGSTGTQECRVAGGLVTYLGEFEAYWEYLLDHAIISSAANPGFGGGGLFTITGCLAGIVSLNLNEIARNSLAIPIECYRTHESELLRYGRVVSRPRRAWLGVYAQGLEEGVVVAGLVGDGPGDRGGLREGDVVMSLNGADVGSRRDLYLALRQHEPGERLTIEVMRDEKLERLEVTGGDRAEFFRLP
jgi:S1-C subfamily serine protease